MNKIMASSYREGRDKPMNSLGGEDPKPKRIKHTPSLQAPRRNGATANSCSPGFPKRISRTDVVAGKIIEAAFKVHRYFGPGLLESLYEKCLIIELQQSKCRVECQTPVDIMYRGVCIESGFRLDMCVDNLVIVENKTVERLETIHRAQLITYLKLTNCTLGLLINWNVALLRHGLKRVVLNHPERMS